MWNRSIVARGAGVVALSLVIAYGAPHTADGAVPAEGTANSSTFYFVSAHPDDEAPGWQLIDDFQAHYPVFVMLTRGEGTYACLTHEDAATYEGAPRKVSIADDGTVEERPTAGA